MSCINIKAVDSFFFCWFSFSLMKSSDIDQDLFTDSYCKVCSAQLISESQRVAHYEVRTAFPIWCFQWKKEWCRLGVGLEDRSFSSQGMFQEPQGLSLYILRSGWGKCACVGWGQRPRDISLRLWLLPRFCLFIFTFFLCLSPWRLSGLSLLVKSVIAHPWSSFQGHRAGCISASFSFLLWPWR